MAPSHTLRDRDSLDRNSCQTIDLTLSSPEPEPEARQRPQPRPQSRPPQRQAQLYSGSEPRQYAMSNVKIEGSQPVAFARNPVARQQARPIHPGHLKHIIDTADPHALQKVLLQLCRVSPALSGALVRGLSPHSISAQNMISQHRVQSQQLKVKIQNDDSDQLYEVAKSKLAGPVPPNSDRSKLLPLLRRDNGSQNTRDSHGSSSTARVKHEPRERSVRGADGDLRLSGVDSRTIPHLPIIRTPIRKSPGHSSSFDQSSGILTKGTSQSTNADKASVPRTNSCIVCREPFLDVNAPCVSHPGRRMRQGDGSIMWSCCGEDSDDPGCSFYGQHVTGEEPEEDAHIHQKRPSASPEPSRRPVQKRPRAF